MIFFTFRYLSLHDNKYIRYFSGHTKKVVSLCVSPIEDMFVSGSLDKSLRLWDLRSPNGQGYINVMGRPVAAFDPDGLVLAAGINSETLKLFDVRWVPKSLYIKAKYHTLTNRYISKTTTYKLIIWNRGFSYNVNVQ